MEFKTDDFSRIDDTDDARFYQTERFVDHLDAVALDTVEQITGQLITQPKSVVLDLMASWDSHLPQSLTPAKVVGLGLNESELRENKALSDYIIHDLNKEPNLPFEDDLFDAVICTVSVDYMTRPVDVFKEVGRILKPGGLYLTLFSNRMFPPKAVRVWREASEEERVLLVQDFFRQSSGFEKPHVFISRGKPRPKDDQYAHLGIPSDPVYAVYARSKGGAPAPLPEIKLAQGGARMSATTIEQRKKAVKDTLRCPHCDAQLKKWEVPQTLFTEWPNEFFYVCMNDECAYYVTGWEVMAKQGNECSYRLMYDPLVDCCQPIPVMSPKTLKDGIIE